jgi:hypothetical protein
MSMIPAIRISTVAILGILLLGFSAAGEGVPRAKINKAGKAATVLVLGKSRGAQASAFCVHPGGFFVTNEHAVRDESGISLVLDSGLKSARVVAARVVRTDSGLDLALLHVEGLKDFPTLPLGSTTNIAETDELIVFGFPFGRGLARTAKDHPAISVNVGKVTSLREKDGELDRIQLDAVIQPGNSGGPVVDKDGKVAGVVVSGVSAVGVGTGVNFAIPVSHLQRFLARPEITFDEPVLKLADIHNTLEFQARAVTLVPSGKPLELQLILKSAVGARRLHEMKAVEGAYRVSAVPIPRPKGPALYRLTAMYGSGSVVGEVADQAFKVGATSVKLAEVRRLLAGSPPRVWLREGKVLRGEISGADSIGVRLGRTTVSLDLSKADELRVQPAADVGSLTATIVARSDGKEVGRLTRSLAVQGIAGSGEEELFLDIDVAPLEKDVVVRKMDAPIADVAVGGGGRFLILHLPKLGKLAVFDVNEAKVVKLLPMADENIKFTAGLDKLVVALPGSRTIQRWSLKSFEQELSVPYPDKGEIQALSMGSASQGPLLVLGRVAPFPAQNPFLLTLDKLERREIIWTQTSGFSMFGQQAHIRSSPDGRSMGIWTSSHFPTGVTWIHLDNQQGKRSYNHASNGHVIPGLAGKVLFTGQGMFTSIGPQRFMGSPPVLTPGNQAYPGSESNGCYVPAHHGDYYLYLGNSPTSGSTEMLRGITIHKLGVDKPIGRVDGITVRLAAPSGGGFVPRGPGRRPGSAASVSDFTFDKHFHLIPEGKVLIHIPSSNDQLVLHRVNLEAAADRTKGEKK